MSSKKINIGITEKDEKNIERMVCFLFGDIWQEVTMQTYTNSHPRAAYEEILTKIYNTLKVLVKKYFKKRPGPLIFRKCERIDWLDMTGWQHRPNLQFVRFRITVTVPPRNDLFAQTPIRPYRKIR